MLNQNRLQYFKLYTRQSKSQRSVQSVYMTINIHAIIIVFMYYQNSRHKSWQAADEVRLLHDGACLLELQARLGSVLGQVRQLLGIYSTTTFPTTYQTNFRGSHTRAHTQIMQWAILDQLSKKNTRQSNFSFLFY